MFKNLSSKVKILKETLWAKFLPDFQNVGTQIFLKESCFQKKYKKILGEILISPKMTINSNYFLFFSRKCWGFDHIETTISFAKIF